MYALALLSSVLSISLASAAECNPGKCAADLDFAGSSYAGCGTAAACLKLVRPSPKLAQWKDGRFTSFEPHQPAITNMGLLVEDGRLNLVRHARDCSVAPWEHSGVTCRRQAAGIEGTANAASVVSATQANGRVCQKLPLQDGVRAFSVFLRRRTGLGAINISWNGGVDWRPVQVAARYERVAISALMSDPVLCVQLAKAGDQIDLDFLQLEDGYSATSPIATQETPMRRLPDLVEFTGAMRNCVVGARGSLVFEGGGIPAGNFRRQPVSILQRLPTDNIFFANQYMALQVQAQVAGKGYPTARLGTGGLTTPYRLAAGWDTTGVSIAANGGEPARSPETYKGEVVKLDPSFNSYLRRLSCWSTRHPDAVLKTVTRIEPEPLVLTDKGVAWRNVSVDEKIQIGDMTYVAQNGADPRSLQIGPDGKVFRFNVFPNNPWKHDVWSSERSELAGYPSKIGETEERWVSYSFMIEPGAEVTSNWLGLGQWLQVAEVGGGPSVAHLYKMPETMTFVGATEGAATARTRKDHHVKPLERGRWYHVVSNVRFDAEGNTGKWVTWLDGRKIVDYKGPLGIKGSNGYYWKFGAYRSLVPEPVSVRYANMTVGRDDLSAKVAKPDPIPPGYCYCKQ